MSDTPMGTRMRVVCQLAAFSLVLGTCFAMPARAFAADEADGAAEQLLVYTEQDVGCAEQSVIDEDEVLLPGDSEEVEDTAITEETTDDDTADFGEAADDPELAEPEADALADEDGQGTDAPLPQAEDAGDGTDTPATDGLVPMAVADEEVENDESDDAAEDSHYGWTTIDGVTYYYDEYGNPVTGWMIDYDTDKQYYFDENGAACTGWKTIKGSIFHFDQTTFAADTGWKTISGKRYYFDTETCAAYVGLKSISGKKYYFSSSGAASTGWKTVGGRKYYFDAKTYAAYTGLKTISGKKYYFYSGGAASSGWKTVDGRKYYFSEKNYAAYTGLRTIDGKKYYFYSGGAASTGWKTVDGRRYYFSEKNYAAYTGFKTISGKKYYFYSGGAASTGWRTISGNKYYFDTKTFAACKGWKTIGGKKYYFDSACHMKTGIVKIGDKRYAFATSGVLMSSGIRTIDGKKYYVNKDGSLGYGIKTIDGKKYVFLSSDGGAMAKSCLYENYIVAWDGVLHAMPAESGGQDASAQRMASLIAKCITPASKIASQKDLTRAREAAAYVAAFADRGTYTMKGKLYRTPYGVFYGKQYSCAGTTRALGAVFNKLGFTWKHVNENQFTHQWCKVKLDGKWGWGDSCIEYETIDWDTGEVLSSVVTGRAEYGKHFVEE